MVPGDSATVPGSNSCWIPWLSCIHRSIAIPTASGTDNTLFGPSPIVRSDYRTWMSSSTSTISAPPIGLR
jgi:hypothetical protein